MSVTVETLAAALREALPGTCKIIQIQSRVRIVHDGTSWSVVVIGDQMLVEVGTLSTRADRNLARTVFDCIDRLEDRDGK